MAYFIGPFPVVGEITDIHDSAVNRVGTRAFDNNGSEYVFLKGVANTIAGSWVAFDEAGVTALMDTDVAASVLSPVAVAMAAIVANKYGWYMVKGSTSAVAGDVADNGAVYATSTAGTADDAAVVGAQVIGAVWRSEDANSLATVHLNNPFIGVVDTDT